MSTFKKLFADVNGNLKNSIKALSVKPIAATNLGKSLVLRVENIRSNTQTGAALNTKVIEVISWYEKISGMDEVRIAQNKVIDAELQFVRAQAERREANKELTDMQRSLKDLREEIDTTTRGERRYILLVTKEHEMLQEEQKLIQQFNHCEERERELFAVLSCTVRESHEKERTQALRTKYWSLIASVVGAFLGLVASTINGNARMKEIKKLLLELRSAKSSPTSSISPDLSSKVISSLTPLIDRTISETEASRTIASTYYEQTKNIILVSAIVIVFSYLFR